MHRPVPDRPIPKNGDSPNLSVSVTAALGQAFFADAIHRPRPNRQPVRNRNGQVESQRSKAKAKAKANGAIRPNRLRPPRFVRA